MTTRIGDVDGHRMLEIDATNTKSPDSIFIAGPLGFCMEFDRKALTTAILLELGLLASVESSLDALLGTVALA